MERTRRVIAVSIRVDFLQRIKVTFYDMYDIRKGMLYGNQFRRISRYSLRRLVNVINSGMELELDQFFYPTWTRKHPDDCPGCDYCSDRWTN